MHGCERQAASATLGRSSAQIDALRERQAACTQAADHAAAEVDARATDVRQLRVDLAARDRELAGCMHELKAERETHVRQLDTFRAEAEAMAEAMAREAAADGARMRERVAHAEGTLRSVQQAMAGEQRALTHWCGGLLVRSRLAHAADHRTHRALLLWRLAVASAPADSGGAGWASALALARRAGGLTRQSSSRSSAGEGSPLRDRSPLRDLALAHAMGSLSRANPGAAEAVAQVLEMAEAEDEETAQPPYPTSPIDRRALPRDSQPPSPLAWAASDAPMADEQPEPPPPSSSWRGLLGRFASYGQPSEAE